MEAKIELAPRSGVSAPEAGDQRWWCWQRVVAASLTSAFLGAWGIWAIAGYLLGF